MVAQIDKELLLRRPWKVPGRLFSYAFIEGRPLTTKGRWINGLVFALYRLAQVIPAPKRRGQVVFIVGTGRSGTTILGKLFSIHREVVFLNEPKALWHFAYPREDLIGSYSEGQATVVVEPQQDSQLIANKVSRVYRWAQFWGGARCVVDKYPELVFRDRFVFDLFPDAKFIAMLRNGVDTCCSIDKWSAKNGLSKNGETHDWWGRDDRKWRLLVDELVPLHPDLCPYISQIRQFTDHRDRAAVEWILAMRAAVSVTRSQPESVHIVRYEDLCNQPSKTLSRLLEFCGLKSDYTFFRYAESKLSRVSYYPGVALDPIIVVPFRETMVELGYRESCDRVQPRIEHDEEVLFPASRDEYARSTGS
ncbi:MULTISPECIES: sulfotransferase family protein [Halocynthiibacter]|uniref:Sulfotransferase n=1 Tax=Halocynthiibacter halioticoli TaxID=2986804 RepID=A0AAE3LU77_9RHOB|nr:MULTISPECIES: sulfotransferase [Halocynthiibacter]MCV6823110.1 sulfotransferase [Halocynthiibacter halioticoli]MCW4056111.1 sulfotransferase [Halocynthiibacter sp. SDUM655004]